MAQPALVSEIGKNDKLRSSGIPSQMVSEKERTPQWYYQNAKYVTSFYNQQPGALNWPVTTGSVPRGTGGGGGPFEEILSPVQHMIRMFEYYLGQQPNIDSAFAAEDITQQSIQAMLIKSQTVKEFVDFFRGTMLSRLTNAKWSANPLSKRATSARTNMFDKLMLAYDLKPFLKEMAERTGASFSPSDKSFELPENVQRFMETDWKEYGSELLTDMANGVWFTEQWTTKAMSAFLHLVVTCNCAMHHYALNGRITSEIIKPYQHIKDLRVDDDFGTYDEFAGKIDCATPVELSRRFPELSKAQIEDLEQIAKRSDQWSNYTESGATFNWYNNGGKSNTVTYATCYFRTKNFTGLKETKRDKDYQDRIAKTEKTKGAGFAYDDIGQVTVIGNKYILRTGYIDNLVETIGDVSRPMMPIIRFQPNTVMGQSVSEVSRIHKTVSECDYLGFKIRQAVGRAKGKVYVIWGEKFSADNTPKEFAENMASFGIHMMAKGNGEINSDKGSLVDELDWTLDPNVMRYHELIIANEEKMKRTMSVSDMAMGQPKTYFGNNTMNTAINQNTIGMAPMFDNFMNWLVLNMRYVGNATKTLMLLGNEENKEMQFYVGDRGLVFIKLFEDFTFEQIGFELKINDILDDNARKDFLEGLKLLGQTSGATFNDYLEAATAGTVTELKNTINYNDKRRKQDATQQAATEQQYQQQNIQQQKAWEAMIADNKEANANFRKEIDAMMKGYAETIKQAVALTPVPLEEKIQSQNEQ